MHVSHCLKRSTSNRVIYSSLQSSTCITTEFKTRHLMYHRHMHTDTCEYDRGDADSDRRFCFLFFLACRLLLDVLLECCRCDSSSAAMCSLNRRTRSASSVSALKAESDSSRGRTCYSAMQCVTTTTTTILWPLYRTTC